MKNFIKGVTIVLLVFLTLFQTAKLWLYNSSSHSFFYNFFNTSELSLTALEEHRYFINPSEIICNFGNEGFYRFYPGTNMQDIENLYYEILKNTFANGKFLAKTNKESAADLLTQKSVLLKYNFQVPTGSFAYAMYEKAQNIENQITEFNKILIIPTKSNVENMKIYFINTDADEYVCFELSSLDYQNQEMAKEIDKKTEIETSISYISSEQRSFTAFKNNVYLPRWQSDKVSYSALKKDSRYEDNLMYYVKYFYKTAPKVEEKNNTYTFNDGIKVVKFNSENKLLEYFDYSYSDNSNKMSFHEAYSTANNFLLKDVQLENKSIFLNNISFDEKNYYFYFDYCLENFPLYLSPDLKDKLNIESSIEIVVSNSGISRYKRYTDNFTIDSDKQYMNIDFSMVLDELLEEGDTQLFGGILDLSLIYLVDKTDEVNLFWQIEKENEILIKNTFKR